MLWFRFENEWIDKIELFWISVTSTSLPQYFIREAGVETKTLKAHVTLAYLANFVTSTPLSFSITTFHTTNHSIARIVSDDPSHWYVHTVMCSMARDESLYSLSGVPVTHRISPAPCVPQHSRFISLDNSWFPSLSPVQFLVIILFILSSCNVILLMPFL